ncbi:ABC1 kinase family protein [Antrihabitans cavernicola]|uniref:AarF/ABC1/UbiB kinase family protein n=1 Tax=Antrihabitans cavernicola TaxID=2495913 RepID=A0A5A7S6M2_9NOCA|nr:AarF/UbiB family protein [Spelaeibacter cavernicola]KAA0021798.1 AarF/ABC1/UbiB kinase family protein [Spelaeibacter cavernicola]
MSPRGSATRSGRRTRPIQLVPRALGPFAGGPPPEALVVREPALAVFGLTELTRVAVACATLTTTTALSTAKWIFRRGDRGIADAASEGVVDGLMRLGPTFVKMGQLMASSSGVFPRPLADACLRCLDEVPPFRAAQARKMIEADLGHPISKLFKEFDDVPLSAASVAQVHACVLDDGRQAVIKVQRPDIARRMVVDLRAAYRIARSLERHFEFFRIANATAIIRDLHHATMTELNSAVEATRQDQIRANFGVFGDNTGVTAPEIYWDYCGPRTICMERMFGIPLDRFEELIGRDLDTEMLIRRGVKAWLESVIVHGPFHGDVHAGNLWVLDDGRLALLDFGIVGELPQVWRKIMRDLFYANAIDGDFSRVAKGMRDLGYARGIDIGDDRFGNDLQAALAPLIASDLASMKITGLIMGLIEIGRQWNMSSPEALVLLGKQIGYFERYAVELAPDWNLGRDLFLYRNIFPEAVAEKSATDGTELPAD